MKPNATRTALIVTCLLTWSGPRAIAQVALTTPAPKYSLIPKISSYGEYEFRGISQTAGRPAVQLNLDYSHPKGLYLGVFASNIQWLKKAAQAGGFSTPARIEVDLFGGYKTKVGGAVTLDLGYVRYQYPSSRVFVPSPNTDEFYAGLGAGAFSVKYSHSTSPLFGVANSKNSGFLELNWSHAVAPRITLNAQLARQMVKKNADFSYNVVKLGASLDLGRGFALGVYGKGTDAKLSSYSVLGRDLGKSSAIAFVSKSF